MVPKLLLSRIALVDIHYCAFIAKLVLYLKESLNALTIIFACMISFHNIMIYLLVFKVHRFLY